MKAIMEFDLPEDECSYKKYLKGPDALLCLEDIYQFLRQMTKHEELSLTKYREYDVMYRKFFEILQDHGVDIYE